MNWERQFESMIASDHLNEESMGDLAVAYTEETGDLSLFEIDPIILMGIKRPWDGDGSISGTNMYDNMDVSVSESKARPNCCSLSSGSYRSVGRTGALEWSFSGSRRHPLYLQSISFGSRQEI